MFSEKNTTCGTRCNSGKRKRRADKKHIIKEGWTKHYLSKDTPLTPENAEDPGDHEQLYFFQNEPSRLRTQIFDSSGQAFGQCEKIAIHVREIGGDPWHVLMRRYTLSMDDN